ncbi:MAG: DNA-3-methyladenine glycosylase 2 family protein [Xanthobacteraceae bacterium]|nr:MAG: DNA-3-methyladenine glycosylase 2 family protein [Xanthobacteraceae bacterium]
MPTFLRSQHDLDTALGLLLARDARLAAVREAAGAFALRQRPAGFAGLTATIVGQQLSIASAAAIWRRLSAAFDPFHPEALRRARADRLARLGLSAAKIRTLRAVTRAIAAGELDLDALGRCEADEAHRRLVAVHGIGPWTADIYLLFCLGHADAWPAGDLALKVAVTAALRLPDRPSAKEMAALAEPWRPWRGVAAHLLWAYYPTIRAAARNAAAIARR